MEHQEYQELLVLHSLDALDAAEARGLEEHLATCAECRDELIALRDAGGLLAHAATPAEPGPEVRARLLASVTAERRQDRPAATSSARVLPLKPRAERNLWTIGLRLAAAIAFVALLVAMIVLWRRDVKMRQEIAQLSRQANTQQRELLRDRDVLERQRGALALFNSPTAKRMELAGTQTAARGIFVYDPKTGRAILMAEGLPATPADKAYELWFIPKGHSPMPGRIFTVDASGHAMLPEQMPAEAMAGAVVAITLEPKKGSAVPTMPIYLSSPSS